MDALRDRAPLGFVPAPEPAFLSRLRLRARRCALWLRVLWGERPADHALRLAVSEGEVERILGDGAARALAELEFYETNPEAAALANSIEEADRQTAADPMMLRLREELGLGDAELDLLSMTVAVEADPWLRRVFGYLHDDITNALPTPWLARQVFQWPAEAHVAPDCALIRWRLAHPVDGHASPWSAATPWVADPHIVDCCLRGMAFDPALGDSLGLAVPAERDPRGCLYPSERDALVAFVRALTSPRRSLAASARNIELVIGGAEGAGKRTLAAEVCADLGIPLLVADAEALLGGGGDLDRARETVMRVQRLARLMRGAVFWNAANAVPPGAWHDSHGRVLSFFGTSAAAAAELALGASSITKRVRLPSLTEAERASFWSRLSALPAPSVVLDWPLVPREIARAAAAAPAGPAAVAEACRPTLGGNVISLATPLPRPYDWNDLVLPAAVRRHLGELEAQAKLRWPVYEQWGFSRLRPTGRGLSALFAGPSGTGKTMAAQVLARALEMEIYRVDLAGLMSKYIGETEKNLRCLFDGCEHGNVVLFFDEADAVFGRRTQVKDAHDRFANITIDYLLQRMEQFEGLVVLATNRRGDLDRAFLRRLRFLVDFPPPGVAERLALWRRALPGRAPDGQELLGSIDWDLLATRLEMTGADIKGAALSAAFLARSEGVRIGMSQIVRASRRELAKHGIPIRPGDLEVSDHA